MGETERLKAARATLAELLEERDGMLKRIERLVWTIAEALQAVVDAAAHTQEEMEDE